MQKKLLLAALVATLVPGLAACKTAEEQLKQQAPNKVGLEGCVVVFKLGLSPSG